MNSNETEPVASTVAQLRAIYVRNGYVRRLNAKRRRKEKRGYHKGDEIRLVAESTRELREIGQLLRSAGFEPGTPFAKHSRWVQPLYGRNAVAEFSKLIGEKGESKRKKKQTR